MRFVRLLLYIIHLVTVVVTFSFQENYQEGFRYLIITTQNS